jgi:hypothetical protein
VFKLQERLKAFGKDGESAIRQLHVVGAGTMGERYRGLGARCAA